MSSPLFRDNVATDEKIKQIRLKDQEFRQTMNESLKKKMKFAEMQREKC